MLGWPWFTRQVLPVYRLELAGEAEAGSATPKTPIGREVEVEDRRSDVEPSAVLTWRLSDQALEHMREMGVAAEIELNGDLTD
jgi:hypothetical protein